MTTLPDPEMAGRRYFSGPERTGWRCLWGPINARMGVHGGHFVDLCRRSVLLSLMLAAPIRASESVPGHLLFRDERPTFRAGDVVNLQWTPLPPEAEEFELLLSLDGGRHFVRLTEMQGPGARTLEWRVPNLPSGDARLRLRMGRMGEEIELELSAPFTIVGSEDKPVAGVSFREGEWWTSQVVLVVPPDVQTPCQRAEIPWPRDWAAHLAPSLARDFIVTAPPPSISTYPGGYADPFSSDRPPPRGRCPRIIPLRE
jgi:hypothetical protein